MISRYKYSSPIGTAYRLTLSNAYFDSVEGEEPEFAGLVLDRSRVVCLSEDLNYLFSGNLVSTWLPVERKIAFYAEEKWRQEIRPAIEEKSQQDKESRRICRVMLAYEFFHKKGDPIQFPVTHVCSAALTEQCILVVYDKYTSEFWSEDQLTHFP